MFNLQDKYLGKDAALKLDQDLMSPAYGFSVYQLMELAGILSSFL